MAGKAQHITVILVVFLTCVPTDDNQLNVLACMWDQFFTETLPTLQAIFYPVQVKCSSSTLQKCIVQFFLNFNNTAFN